MSSDDGLLKLAAHGAGIELVWSSEPGWAPKLKTNRMQSWNPLDDSGDALSLAIKLKMTVKPGIAFSDIAGFMSQPATEKNSDEEATRRAIVRCAAEIGLRTP